MANNASARMLGYADASELLKVHPSTLSPETQPDGQPSFHKAEALIKEAHDKGYLRFEWVHLRKDKTPRLTEVSLTRIPNPGGACNELFCVWHDITDRRRAEA
jgi:PAS domain S-box-containing protein